MATHGETRKRALREAGSLLQTYGYHGFSFQDLADALGIKKPSLYDHFASKEELAILLIDDYRVAFERWATTIQAMDARTKIKVFFELFERFAKDGGKYCPITILAAEMHSLPGTLKDAIKGMCRFQTRWLQDTIEQGQKAGQFRRDETKQILADNVMAMMIGSQFLARMQAVKKIDLVLNQTLLFLQDGA